MVNMTALAKSLKGVHNFLPTPLLPDYKVDLYGMRENVVYHSKNNPSDMTVTVCGGFGEGLALDADEHKDVVAAAVDGAGGAIGVVAVALGGYGMQRKMVMNAQEAGASSVRVRFPTFGDTLAGTAYKYLRSLAESIEIGMVIFVMGEHDFWPDVLAQLADVPNIVGFSPPGGPDSSDRVGKAVQELVPGRYIWINENEKNAMKSFPNGCEGYTTAVASIIPGACREFWRYGMSGDADLMIDTYENRIRPIIDIRTIGGGSGIGGIKVALEATGRFGGPTRLPESPVSDSDKQLIVNVLRRHPEVAHMVID